MCTLALGAASLSGCGAPLDDEPASNTAPLINGTPDASAFYSGVARVVLPSSGVCTGFLVARRVVMTAAHCIPLHVTRCTSLQNTPLSVRFDATSSINVTIPVQGFAAHLQAPSSLTCPSTSAFCSAGVNSGNIIRRWADPAFLFLASEAPPWAEQIPILVSAQATSEDLSSSAAELAIFEDLETWASTQPLVTTVGYGVGSALLPGSGAPGRDYGVQTWVATESLYNSFSGVFGCDSQTAFTTLSNPLDAVRLSPLDVNAMSLATWNAWAPGAPIPLADQSHSGTGDSGGPALVGPGLTSMALSPTPLDPPGPNDTYDPQKQYAIGVASGYNGDFPNVDVTVGASPSTIFSPTASIGALDNILTNLLDSDGDGLANTVDPAPPCPQTDPDFDGDGLPDECDVCDCDCVNATGPCTPDNDADGDGVCRDACPGEQSDNCPTEANTSQSNCNALSELAQMATPLGDACDPVPCAENVARPDTFSILYNKSNVATHSCERITRGEIRLRPLESHHITATVLSEPVEDVPTHARFCQKKPLLGIDCDDLALDVRDDLLLQNDCTLFSDGSTPSGCSNPEGDDTRFHRISFVAGGYALNDELGLSLDYEFPATDIKSESGALPWDWSYTADAERWRSVGNPVLMDIDTASDLVGTLWIHSDTEVGDTIDVGTGVHGDQLANHHQTNYVPEEARCRIQVTMRAVLKPFFIMFTLPDPGPTGAFSRWDDAPGESSLFVNVLDTEWGALDSRGDVQIETSRFGSGVLASLANEALVWANPVEPFAHQGMGQRFPIAVALTDGGSQVADMVRYDGVEVLGLADQNELPPIHVGSPNAEGYAAVLTRVRGGIYVIGGDDPATGEPTGEIWFTGIESTTWRRLRAAWKPARVLAATYSFASDELFILDETDDGEARLWATDAAGSTAARMLSRSPRNPEFDRHDLVIDYDGALLIASSRSDTKGKKEHRIARIDVRGGGATVDGVAIGNRAPPLVHGAGYTLVTMQSQGNDKVKVERLDALDLGPATMADVAEQL